MQESGTWIHTDPDMSRAGSILAGEGGYRIEAADIELADRAGIGKVN